MTVTPANNHSFVEFHVPNVKKARDFYLNLGFKLVWEVESYAVLKLDKSLITVFQGPSGYFDSLDQNIPRGFKVEIAINVESQDIKDFYKFCQENIEKFGGKVVEPLVLQDYGKWDFRITDPFGLYLRFTEPENILYC